MGALRKAFFTSMAGLGRNFERAARLSFSLATGVMRLEDIRRAILRQWQDFGANGTDRSDPPPLMGWEADLYSRFLKPEDRILLVGCGSGRDLLALLERGYRVEGLDLVPGCIASARRLIEARGLTTPLYAGAFETTPLPGRFDALIFSWFCYSYIPQSKMRIEVLRKAKRHLNPEGRILISYVPSTGSPRRLPIQLTRVVAWLSGSDWFREYGDQVDTSEGEMDRVRYVHCFGPGDFEQEAQAAGLTIAFHERLNEGRAVLIGASRSEQTTE